MKYIVTLPGGFSGMRYGIKFTDGVGETSDQWVARHLSSAGIEVEEISGGGDDDAAADNDAQADDDAAADNDTAPNELKSLKAEADGLGLKYSHNIGADNLRKRIEEFKADGAA